VPYSNADVSLGGCVGHDSLRKALFGELKSKIRGDQEEKSTCLL
jgi:hypothetical protein